MAKKKKVPRLIEPKEIEYYEKNTKVRWILALVFFVIGVVALAIGVKSCVSGDPGWRAITSTATVTNCSDELQLQYFISEDEDINEVNREVTRIYTETTYKAWQLFYVDAPVGNGGLRDINSKPNEAVKVDPVLYRALAQVDAAGDRQIYMAPILEEYKRVFNSEDVVNAELNDPGHNPEVAAYIAQIAAFTADPAHISLELLGNDQVKLHVSQAYMDFVKNNEYAAYLDFGWLCHAFCVDYVAEELIAAGYTRGFLSSYDGFTRRLDNSRELYRINVYDRLEQDSWMPALLEYTGATSLVAMRNYPIEAYDSTRICMFPDGTSTTYMIDPADGMSKSSTDNLLAISHTKSCAEMALGLSPVYIAQDLDEAALIGLNSKDIQCVWAEGSTLKYTGSLRISLLEQKDQPAYTLQPMN